MRWVTPILLLLFWVLVAAGNAQTAWRGQKSGGHFSLVLIIGGVIGAAGVLALPIEGTWRWAWVPAVLDLGSLPALVLAVVALVRGKRSGGD
jgi:hypothetical protein